MARFADPPDGHFPDALDHLLLERVFACAVGGNHAALDIAHQLALLRHLRRAAQGGAGVVLVLHDLAHAMNHADRVVVLDRGVVAADGACEDALDQQVIERVWKVPVRWIGEPRHRALVSR